MAYQTRTTAPASTSPASAPAPNVTNAVGFAASSRRWHYRTILDLASGQVYHIPV